LPDALRSPARAGDFGLAPVEQLAPWEAKEILYLITKIKSSILPSGNRRSIYARLRA
jgi:hypothetical protein